MIRQILLWILLAYSPLAYADSIADTVSSTCTAKVDGVMYTAYYYADEKIELKNAKGTTVLLLKQSDAQFDNAGISGCKFVDFNGDGYQDLIVRYMTNVPDICELILYDQKLKKFIKITGFDAFPAPAKLPGIKMYYSYHRSGCADSNWGSDLFVIRNFKAVKLGSISGVECDESDIKDGVYIYKTKSKQILYKKLPIETIHDYKGDKWGFINDYWKHHYKAFL